MEQDNIHRVVTDRLCVRCGICSGVCPLNAIGFNRDAFPVVDSRCKGCGLCVKVCPGKGIDLSSYFKEGLLGYIKKVYFCRVKDKEILLQASSGGVVTGIASFLLKRGIADGVVCVHNEPFCIFPCSKIRDTPNEVLISRGSKYVLFPWGIFLKEFLRDNRYKNLVVTGLPCHLHGLEKLCKVKPEIKNRVIFKMGLVCAMNIEPAFIQLIADRFNKRGEKLKEVNFRYGKWPGGVRIIYSDKEGEKSYVLFEELGKEFFVLFKYMFGAERCLLCPDTTAVLSDISFGDPWGRYDNGKLIMEGKDGVTMVICRTYKGVELIETLIKEGVLESVDDSEELLSLCINEKVRQAESKIRDFYKMSKVITRRGGCYPDYGINLKEFYKAIIKSEGDYGLLWKIMHIKYIINFVAAFFLTGRRASLLKLNSIRKELKYRKR